MTSLLFAPILGLTLWLGSIYIDSKFSYKTPSQCGVRVNSNTSWWKRTLIVHNRAIRLTMLFSVWLLISLNVYIAKPAIMEWLSITTYVGVVVSIIIYVISQMWRFYITSSPER